MADIDREVVLITDIDSILSPISYQILDADGNGRVLDDNRPPHGR